MKTCQRPLLQFLGSSHRKRLHVFSAPFGASCSGRGVDLHRFFGPVLRITIALPRVGYFIDVSSTISGVDDLPQTLFPRRANFNSDLLADRYFSPSLRRFVSPPTWPRTPRTLHEFPAYIGVRVTTAVPLKHPAFFRRGTLRSLAAVAVFHQRSLYPVRLRIVCQTKNPRVLRPF